MLSYPNSVHADSPAPAAPPAAPTPAAPDQVPAESAPLDYPNTDKPLPQGTPALELPDAVRELREADGERKMFSPQVQYRDTVQDHPEDNDQVRAFRAEAREQFADLGLSDQDARDVVGVINAELQAGIPAAETRAQWQEQALNDVVRQYGKDAPARIAEARALVARDPRVQKILDDTGLGSHPRVVALMIERARSERGRGRLK